MADWESRGGLPKEKDTRQTAFPRAAALGREARSAGRGQRKRMISSPPPLARRRGGETKERERVFMRAHAHRCSWWEWGKAACQRKRGRENELRQQPSWRIQAGEQLNAICVPFVFYAPVWYFRSSNPQMLMVIIYFFLVCYFWMCFSDIV